VTADRPWGTTEITGRVGRKSPSLNKGTKVPAGDTRPVDVVLMGLERAGCQVHPSGNGHEAQCPAHDDRRASLSVGEGEDGRALLRCHAGCTVDDIVDAIGMEMKDLFPRDSRLVRFAYVDEQGVLLFEVVRKNPKGFFTRRPDGSGGWIKGKDGIEPVLFRLPQVLAAIEKDERVWVVEGEKDVLALEAIGEVATCNPFGAGKWRPEYSRDLKGAEVVIIQDNDEKGRDHAQAVAESLDGLAKSLRLLRPADGCSDVSDHLVGGYTLPELLDIEVQSADGAGAVGRPSPTARTVKPKAKKTANVGGSRTKKMSIRVLEVIEDRIDTFTADGTVYASVRVDGHRETWPVDSQRFEGWVCQEFWTTAKTTVGSTALKEAVQVIQAQARFGGREERVHVRLAKGTDCAIYVDLGDPEWRAVKVTPAGWEVVSEPPVHFVRKHGMLALPAPQHGGSLDDLRRYINATDDGFILMMAWLVGAYCPWGPYPVLDIQGEQGSAKSTACEILQALCDPNLGLLRSAPKSPRDLAIAAQNSRLLAFDNLSWISNELSDALCRLATGGGFATRALFKDAEEVIFTACRPVLMNGIEELGSRPDLLDRILLVSLPSIPTEQREHKKALWEEFDGERPRLLGAVLDAVSFALKDYENVDVPSLERMADFTLWAAAASPAFGGKSAFLRAYSENVSRLNALALESNVVVTSLVDLLEHEDGEWVGNAAQLLHQLDIFRPGDTKSQSAQCWPTSARALGGHLRRLMPALRSVGITAVFTEHGRIWTLTGPTDEQEHEHDAH